MEDAQRGRLREAASSRAAARNKGVASRCDIVSSVFNLWDPKLQTRSRGSWQELTLSFTSVATRPLCLRSMRAHSMWPFLTAICNGVPSFSRRTGFRTVRGPYKMCDMCGCQ